MHRSFPFGYFFLSPDGSLEVKRARPQYSSQGVRGLEMLRAMVVTHAALARVWGGMLRTVMSGVSVWSPLKAELKTRAWVHVADLGGDPRKQA